MATVGLKLKRQGSGHSAKVKSVRSLVHLLNDRVLPPGTTKNVSVIAKATFELIVIGAPCERVVTRATKKLVDSVSTEELIISCTAPENATGVAAVNHVVSRTTRHIFEVFDTVLSTVMYVRCALFRDCWRDRRHRSG